MQELIAVVDILMVNGMLNSLSSVEAAVLNRAWPDGVPDEEIALLRATRPDRRISAIERLKVLLDLEAHALNLGRKHAGYDLIAARIGMGRTGLMKLRTGWRTCRSLASVIHYAAMATPELYHAARSRAIDQNGEGHGELASRSGKVRNASEILPSAAYIVRNSEKVRGFVADTINSHSTVTNGEVGRRLLVEFPDLNVSRPVAVACAQSVRREMENQPDRLTENFGKRILIDLCAIDLFIEEQDDKKSKDGASAAIAVISVVMETSSRNVLGWAIGQWPGLDLQLAALDEAMITLAQQDVQGSIESADEVKVSFVPGLDRKTENTERTPLSDSPLVALPMRGPRRFGRQMTSLLGARIGKLGLRPGSTAPSADRTLLRWSPVVRTWEDAKAFVSAAIQRHQTEVDARLFMIDLQLRNSRTGAMRRKLAAIRALTE